MKRARLLVMVLVIMCMVVATSTMAMADVLTDYGLKPLGSYDLGGNTVTIISWTSERMQNYFNDYIPVRDRIAEAEELFNCKIEFMQTREIPETNFNRLMAGESAYDLWHVQNKIGYFELVSEGAVLAASDFLPTEFFEALPPFLQSTEEALKFHGKYYGIGNVEWRPMYGYANDIVFVGYNKTLFEREGLPDLFDLYLDGEWTWEKAGEIAAKATRDLDGDGETDQYGMTDLRAWDLAISNGTNVIKLDENGRVIYTADEDAYIEAVEQFCEWWSTGVLNQSTNTGNNRQMFIDGLAAMHFNITPAVMANNIIPGNMADEWAIVPFPMGPRVTEHLYPNQALSTTLIPVNAADPEALVALKVFLWQEDDITTNDFLAAHVRTREAGEVLLEAHEYWTGSSSRLLETYITEFNDAIAAIRDEGASPATSLAEIRPVIQARINELFNQ